MLNNDVLRSLRYLLDLPDAHLAELAAPFGEQVEADLLEAYLKKEDEDGFQIPTPLNEVVVVSADDYRRWSCR